MATVAAGKVDTSSTVTAANIQHPKPLPDITQTSAMVKEIDLGLPRQFVPTQEQTVVYVVTPKGPIDPCKRVVVFADCIGSHHGSEAGGRHEYHGLSTSVQCHKRDTRDVHLMSSWEKKLHCTGYV